MNGFKQSSKKVGKKKLQVTIDCDNKSVNNSGRNAFISCLVLVVDNFVGLVLII